MEEKLKKIALKWTKSIGSVGSLLIHSILFIVSFSFYFIGININTILLVLTTIVSLEAIYLAIFIQMTVNIQSKKLHAVAEDVEEIQEDVEEIQEDDDDDIKKIKETMENLMKEFISLKKQLKK